MAFNYQTLKKLTATAVINDQVKTADIGNDLELVILYMRLERLTPLNEKILYNCVVHTCKREMNFLELFSRNESRDEMNLFDV